MSKQTKTLIGCTLLLVLLLGGAAFALTWEGVPEEETAASERIELIKEEKNQVSKIKLETDTEQIELINQGEEEGFSVTGLENMPLSTSAVNSIVEACINLEASQEIKTEEALDLALYGLESPAIKVQMDMQDGKAYQLAIGNEAPSYQGQYVLFNDKVYLISTSVAMSFDQTLYDFVETQILPTKSSDVHIEELVLKNTGRPEIKLTYVPEETIVTEKEPEEGENVDAAPEDTAQNGEADAASVDTSESKETEVEEEVIPAYYKMTAPYAKDLTTYDVTSWADGLFSIYATAVEEIRVDEQKMKDYGFDDPLSVLEIKLSDGQNYRLNVTRQNDTYYMMREGTPIIYNVNQSDLSWLDITPITLTRNMFENRTSDDIASISVTTESETLNLIPDGKELTSEELKEVGNMIIAFTPTKVDPVESFNLQTVATITLSYKDGKTDRLELIPTGSGELYMVLNGVCEYTTNEWSFTSLLEKCKSVYEEVEE